MLIYLKTSYRSRRHQIAAILSVWVAAACHIPVSVMQTAACCKLYKQKFQCVLFKLANNHQIFTVGLLVADDLVFYLTCHDDLSIPFVNKEWVLSGKCRSIELSHTGHRPKASEWRMAWKKIRGSFTARRADDRIWREWRCRRLWLWLAYCWKTDDESVSWDWQLSLTFGLI